MGKRKQPELEPWQETHWQVPGHLSERSAELWRELCPHEARSPERLALLRVGLEALDVVDRCREQIATEGLVVVNLATRTPHQHPAWRIQQDATRTFVQVWRTLGLEYSKQIDGEQLKQFQPEYL